jgi:flavin-dependent dehydrogenase
MLVEAGDFPLVARNLVEDDMAWGYGPRRTTLDKILIDAAAESGADVRPAFNVFEYIIENGTVVGIHGRRQGCRSSNAPR